jgi:hypothetical protein
MRSAREGFSSNKPMRGLTARFAEYWIADIDVKVNRPIRAFLYGGGKQLRISQEWL